MAMSLLLRNANRCPGTVLPKLLQSQNLISRQAGNYSPLQLLRSTQKSLVQQVKCIQVQGKPAVREMGLMSPARHWSVERALAILLYGFIPLAIVQPGVLLFDNLAVVGMVLHSHWGLEGVVIDYVRPIIFGNIIPKMAHVVLALVTIFTMGSLMYFNQTDIGFGQAVRDLWSLKPSGYVKPEPAQ